MLLALILAGSFFIFTAPLTAATTDIVINEIGAYATSTHEWVEIWNKGSDPADLFSWKFWEGGVSHGMAASTTDSVVAPNEYAVIVQDETQFLLDNPLYSGSIFDSVWSSLSEAGEEIGLKDSAGNFVEQFTYPVSSNYSLERRDPFLNDYTGVNWLEHPTGNTIGTINAAFCTGTACQQTAVTSTNPNNPDPEENIVTAPPVNAWPFIKINELAPNPETGNEWVELFNATSTAFDLTGGLICDSASATSSCKATTGAIGPMNWIVVDLGTTRFLNNDADTVHLKNPDGGLIDQIAYGSGAAAVPAKAQSLARKTDGGDTDTPDDWAITTQITPGSANAIVAPVAPSGNTSGGSSVGTNYSTPTAGVGGASSAPAPAVTEFIPSQPKISTSTSPLQLNELYPNPAGSDLNEEFIEIKNISAQTVNLSGWKLSDTQKSFTLSGSIAPGTVLVWPRLLTGISLNNTTKEEVRLTAPDNSLGDIITYNRAESGVSYSRDDARQWRWSEEVTKGGENIIEETEAAKSAAEKTEAPGTGIIWKILAPTTGAPGETLTFNVADSVDPRGGTINFLWNFDDGTGANGAVATHAFASGTYSITVSATSSQQTTGTKQLTVRVGENLSNVAANVIFSEVAPNPTGSDDKEFIELYNRGAAAVDISGWRITDTSKGGFIVPAGTAIASNAYLAFYRAVTKLSLNNSGDRLTLYSAAGETVDVVKFSAGGAGMSYVFINEEWRWLMPPTPGADNGAEAAVLGEKISASTKTQTTRSSSSRSSTRAGSRAPATRLALADARELAAGAHVQVAGTISAAPGNFAKRYFYLSDGRGGIQVYLPAKHPELASGDQLDITGAVRKTSGGTVRISVSKADDIDILATSSTVAAIEAALEELDDTHLGNLVRLSGEITSLKKTGMFIDDGNQELAVAFKTNARIDYKTYTVGQRVAVTGILENTKGGWQLWPRGADDIELLGATEVELQKQVAEQASQKRTRRRAYAIATAAGLAALLVAALIKFKFAKQK